MNTINYNIVADLYDSYVKIQSDISFFLKESKNVKGKVLELMCGTGRISIHLLQNNIGLTCVDYSEGMLKIFKEKIKGKRYKVKLIKMDVSELCLNDNYELIFIPFQSFSEILSKNKQKTALRKIHKHLITNGKFICTFHNPNIKIKLANGEWKILGKFNQDDNSILIYNLNEFSSQKNIVTGFQRYEIYNKHNKLIDKRLLPIKYKIIDKDEFEETVKEIGFKIIKIYGDYNYSSYNEKNSNYIIYVMEKVV